MERKSTWQNDPAPGGARIRHMFVDGHHTIADRVAPPSPPAGLRAMWRADKRKEADSDVASKNRMTRETDIWVACMIAVRDAQD
ncbi:MAG TPA: hypothetical protein VJ886_07775, partial [Roseovarius sp.]|nr:hypothetical protein [Roseovarius sp.]